MIKLTAWYYMRHLPNNSHGKALWVAPDKIAFMEVMERTVVLSEEDLKKPIGKRPVETYTLIGFAACGHDAEPLSFCVQETPEEIFRIIYFWRQDQLTDRRAMEALHHDI